VDKLVGQVTEIELLIERGRLDAARSKLAQVLQENPGEPRVLQLQAFLHYRSGEAQEAREVIDELLMRSPDDEAARNLLFHLQDDAGEYQQAEQTILSLLRDSPEDADYYADYAMLMLTTINLDKADQLAAEALHLEPENQKALLVGVLCDVILRRNKDSEERLTTLIRNYPDSAPTLVMLVVTLEDRNKYPEALEVSRQLLRSDPGNERYVEMTTALQAHNHWSMCSGLLRQ